MKPDIDLRSSRWRAQEWGQRTVERIMGGERFYIFGLTKYGKTVAKFARDAGNNSYTFVDDWTALNSFDGIPVVRTASIAAATAPLIINAVVEGRPYSVDLFLLGKGFFASTSYFHLHAYNNAAFPLPFAAHNMLDIDNRLSAYAALEETLADATSKKEWRAVQYSRYSMDYLTGQLCYRLEEQYWEPDIYNIADVAHFVDGGSFDGKTALEFAHRNPAYRAISSFEPAPDSMEVVVKNTAALAHSALFQKALYSDSKVRHFSLDASASGLANVESVGELPTQRTSPGVEVQCVTLDEALRGTEVSMIKLDLEGAEPEALRGAQNTILHWAPVLTVCVYHDQRHFVDVPEFVLALVPEYKIYFRHYTEGIFESVMYFVKK